MDRRSFLAFLTSAGAGLVIRAREVRSPSRDLNRVLILGAGLSGLCTGYELMKQGYQVTLVEAQGRPGGRVETLREAFSGGVYAEAGAARIPNSHYLTMRYISEFGLRLEPFQEPNTDQVFYLGKQRYIPRGDVRWPGNLTPDEAAAGPDGLLAKYYEPLVRELGPLPLAGRFPPGLEPYDDMTIVELLLKQGASPDAIRLMMAGFDTSLGSAAWWLLEDMGMLGQTSMFRIVGGNDRLPYAFASYLKDRILYDTAALHVEQDDHRVLVAVEHKGSKRILVADRLVMTLPFTLAGQVLRDARLSSAKERAIKNQVYTPVVKVFLQTKSRFWLKDHLSGFANTDLPIQRVWAGSVNVSLGGGLLHSYVMGKEALRQQQTTEEERQQDTLAQVAKVFPEVAREFERGTSKVWQADPWQKGAYAQFNLHQMKDQLPENGRPEGRIHFAGEHTSNWNGWMQGALESAHRVVYEINSLS